MKEKFLTKIKFSDSSKKEGTLVGFVKNDYKNKKKSSNGMNMRFVINQRGAPFDAPFFFCYN